MRALKVLILAGALAGAATAAAAPGLLPGKASGPEYLAVDQAFELQPLQRAPRGVSVAWRIAKDYYLYRDRLKFALVTPAGTAVPLLPAGETHHDEHFGDVTVYRGDLSIPLTLAQTAAKGPVKLTVTYQGCADAGLCYPPQTRTLELPE